MTIKISKFSGRQLSNKEIDAFLEQLKNAKPNPLAQASLNREQTLMAEYNKKGYVALSAKKNKTFSIEEAFDDLIKKYGKTGALLKGLRAREGLTQIEFSKIIGMSQPNISAMESGRRGIGKDVAKRIAKKFKLDC